MNTKLSNLIGELLINVDVSDLEMQQWNFSIPSSFFVQAVGSFVGLWRWLDTDTRGISWLFREGHLLPHLNMQYLQQQWLSRTFRLYLPRTCSLTDPLGMGLSVLYGECNIFFVYSCKSVQRNFLPNNKKIN